MDAHPTTATAAPLPADPALLQQLIRELLAALHDARRDNDHLRARLDQLLRRLYGPRAERFDPNQPWLFPELAAPPSADTPVSLPPPPESAPAPRPTPHGRRRLPAHLRREVRRYELTEAERACPGCGQVRAEIGQEASEQLDWVPASLFVVEHQRVQYACRHCQEHVVTAPKPAQPLDKGLPGPGLLAQVVVSKYADHLPLHRQERILERHGVTLDRSTLCGWMAACAELLTPVYTLM
ncbi:MAG: transposase, partial [Planctomycetia bacterium]|nr:transposase [Planctomycetia bacterium]